MAIGYGVACPKPTRTRKQIKASAKRREGIVGAGVRGKCVHRDGYCRFRALLPSSPCGGPSEWMHLEEKKRAHTVGMAPEDRHTTERSMMGCRRHHRRYDAGEIAIEFLTDRGADGAMRASERT